VTVQFGRQARLLVGTPGNPAKIGTPATSTGSTITIDGASYPVVNGTATISADTFGKMPIDQTTASFSGATSNPDGTFTLSGVTGSAVTSTPGTPNTPATPGQGLDLSQLRFRFSVTHRAIMTPGVLECRVYNLSDATASHVQKEFTRVQLSAGYAGNLGVIFDGTVTQVRKGRESETETYLDVTAVEADQAQNFAVVNTTLAAGSTPDDRMGALLKALEPYGINKGYIPSPLPGSTLPRGRVLFGMVRDHLRDLAAATNCDWNIKDDQLNFVPQDAYAPGDVIEINSRTGMIGLPEQTFGGVVVKCLLNPSIHPGRAVHLNNASIQTATIGTTLNDQVQKGLLPSIAADGYYRVLLVSHEGDTRGPPWYTTVITTGLDAPIPAALIQAPTTIAPGG
jgi:hypothetical protein